MPRYQQVHQQDDQSYLVAKLEPKERAKVELKGSVDFVRVVNEQNGWGFARIFHPAKVQVPVTGIVEDLYEGADVELGGIWVKHSRFGWQIKLERVLLCLPTHDDGVVAWLAYRMPDVGPVRARAIVRAYPVPELWGVLENEPEMLTSVDGIGPAIAEGIARAYTVWKFEREQFAKLAGFGLKPEQIRAAVHEWGGEAAAKIEVDPYITRALPGIGFKAADAIARNMGMKKIDPRRIVAGLGYAAELLEREGHTCHRAKKLMSTACGPDVLGLRPKYVTPVFKQAVQERELIEDHRKLYYRPVMARAEGRAFDRLAELVSPEGRI